jgi:hypothetical protein
MQCSATPQLAFITRGGTETLGRPDYSVPCAGDSSVGTGRSVTVSILLAARREPTIALPLEQRRSVTRRICPRHVDRDDRSAVRDGRATERRSDPSPAERYAGAVALRAARACKGKR